MSVRTTLTGLSTLAAAGAMLAATGGGASAAAPAAPAAEQPATAATTTAQASCSATGKTYGPLRGTWGLSDATRYTASRIAHDAQNCRMDALVWRSTRDKTSLSFGALTPRQVWAVPDRDQRYDATARAMTTQWGTQKNGRWTYRVWPRVATSYWADSDKAWQEAIDAGLITKSEAEWMRRETGYMGYRVRVSQGGRWMYAIAGD